MTTDLTTVKSCEILEDNQESHHFQTGIGGVLQDYDDDYDAAPPAPEALLVQSDSAYSAASSFDSPPKRILEKPNLELRTFFPENWLFDLEYTNDTRLTR